MSTAKHSLPDSLRTRLDNGLKTNYLLSDVEFERMFKLITELSDIQKRAYKRFERRESKRLAKSLVEYTQLLKDRDCYPYELYDFRCLSVRICIVRISHTYHVYIDGYTPTSYRSYGGSYNLYGDFCNLSDCIIHFQGIVADYLHFYAGSFNYGL
ncbi:hypothetical protein [Tortoise microvirus 103]|nr:hypothetical protein [Tortoise microvirus 5]QCS37445.1 hypothetical protein [Tortoise microvirus 103]